MLCSDADLCHKHTEHPSPGRPHPNHEGRADRRARLLRGAEAEQRALQGADEHGGGDANHPYLTRGPPRSPPPVRVSQCPEDPVCR